MRRTERTKEADRNISEGGVGNDTFHGSIIFTLGVEL